MKWKNSWVGYYDPWNGVSVSRNFASTCVLDSTFVDCFNCFICN